MALVNGAAGEHEYTDASVADPAVAALRGRVEAAADEAMRQDEARVSITLADGRVLDCHVEHAVGSVDRPMSDADLEAKFTGLAKGILPAEQISRLIGLCWSITALEDVAEISRASVPLPISAA